MLPGALFKGDYMSNLDFHFTECLILSGEKQAPQIKQSKDGNLNWFEFNVLVSRKNKNDEQKKDINFVVKVMCFNEKIANALQDRIKNDKNNFFTGSCRLQSHMIKPFEIDGKTHNYYKYFTCVLEDFKFVISYSDKQNSETEPNKGWHTNNNNNNVPAGDLQPEDPMVDDDIPF